MKKAMQWNKPDGMDFYPVYRLRRSNGSFSRVGSLLDTCGRGSARITPHVVRQAVALFEQEAGDMILLGPRCASIRRVERGRAERQGFAVPLGVRA
jgi:hypothetical protein